MFSLLSCFKKSENLQSWLDQKFPNQYEVVDNRLNLLPSIYKEKKRTSVVAWKADPEVQFEITWYKNAPELRVTQAEIQKATEQSKKEVAQARQLLQSVQNNGLSKMAVAVIEDATYFLIYEDPSRDNRRKYLTQILSILNAQAEHVQPNIFIEFMEDSVYHQEFKDIIPKGYWNRIDKYHQHHQTVGIDFLWKPGLNIDTLMTGWSFNTDSDKTFRYMNQAYGEVLKWAEQNITPPYYIEPSHFVQYEIDQKDPMAIHFYFPYFSSQPLEDGTDYASKQRGYITGIYQTDLKTFTKIKTIKEL